MRDEMERKMIKAEREKLRKKMCFYVIAHKQNWGLTNIKIILLSNTRGKHAGSQLTKQTKKQTKKHIYFLNVFIKIEVGRNVIENYLKILNLGLIIF